jgi:hypothetical protein
MYLTNTTELHYEAALQCVEYLLATKNNSICLGSSELQPEGFVDASWADNSGDRRSTCGFIFMFGGGPVFWKSGRQPIVATSTTEAEYVAMSLAAREAAALRRLVSEVLKEQHLTIVLHEDNQPAICLLSKPPGADIKTKHICHQPRHMHYEPYISGMYNGSPPVVLAFVLVRDPTSC